MTHRFLVAVGLLCLGSAAAQPAHADLLFNGDFEQPAILGPGQTDVPIGSRKYIQTNPNGALYAQAISGILGWTYATPGGGTFSDHGLARVNASFGLPATGQSAFINNWNRMMSQTVASAVHPGDTVHASVDFGTLGSDTDGGRAGIFYLVAGEANPANKDQFSSRSVVLSQLSVANPTWPGFKDVTVGNRLYITLDLSYTYQPNDPALALPITIAFRTVGGSVGPTYWDNASLTIQQAAVPEPASLISAVLGVAALAQYAGWRRVRPGRSPV